MNITTMSGNITRDPELRVTPSGATVCNFTIANNRKWKDQNGQEKEEVTFLDVAAWNKTAEVIAKFFGKGDPILVHGPLKMEQWDDKQTGQKRSRLKLDISWPAGGFDFMGKTSGSGQGAQPNQQYQQQDNGGGGEWENSQPAPPPRGTPPANTVRGQQRPQQNVADEDVPF
jgi:single-strand DNA-binding protein